MSATTIAAFAALAASLLARRRRKRGSLELDDWAFALTLQLGLIGVIAMTLACCGLFRPHFLAVGCALAAALSWPWSLERDPCPPASRPTGIAHTAVLLVLLGIGCGLRLPPIAAPLAGRDQGTYSLRATSTLRTGHIGWTDNLLATASAELDGPHSPAGALDLLGLYPISDEAWRDDQYEGAYRPGSYLADRDRGTIVPQFFHFHPMVLASSQAAFGPIGLGLGVIWVAMLSLLCLACAVRQLWPRGPWAALALALVVASPLAIWTGRTPLSENPMALFEWAALLAALRMHTGVERRAAGSWQLAACLALAAFVRGNALVILPIVLAFAWFRPRDRSAPAAYLILAGLCASAWLHILTSFPYVHDELLRRLPTFVPEPTTLVLAVGLAALAWLIVDGICARIVHSGRDFKAKFVLRAAVPGLVVMGALAVLTWAWLAHTSPEGPPYSRLDAAPILLGLPLLVLAALGLGLLAFRWRPSSTQVGLLALAAVVPATAWLYAPRGLPTLAFFYYGRYLVPELLPAAVLAATYTLERLTQFERLPKLGRGLSLGLALALLASAVGPLIVYPQLRLREYAPADEAVDWLASQLPADAIVIAGGEGWHSGHTHNQVGGALAMAHGISVLPYRTREDAWISAWELLVAGPERRGQPAPRVFLLINEAAHPTSRENQGRIAMVDDQLWAPFVVERAAFLELFVHASSPAPDRLPTRVARHELRMALFELRVDPHARGAIETIHFEDTCVSPNHVVELDVPRPAWARHVVLVAADLDPKMARKVPKWRVRLDGERLALDPPAGLRPRARATLGPLPLPDFAPAPKSTLHVEIRGADMRALADPSAACPHGRLAAIQFLPAERGAMLELSPDAITARRFAPASDLGHPIEPTHWVSGRSLSRYRPGTLPTPELRALAMLLDAGAAIEFAGIDLPLDTHGHPRPLDVVVTLAKSSTLEEAPLWLYADDELIGSVSIPAQRKTSYVARGIVWQPKRPRGRLRVELDPSAGGAIEVRDVALFTHDAGIASSPP